MTDTETVEHINQCKFDVLTVLLFSVIIFLPNSRVIGLTLYSAKAILVPR